MLRIFLIKLALFLLPFLVYGLLVHVPRRLFPGKPDPGQTFSRAVLAWLSACGLLLVAAGLFAFALIEGEAVGKKYAPPRFERGAVIPGQFK